LYSLLNDTTGSSNIAIGFEAGENITVGSNNITIGSVGAATDDSVIRIGTDNFKNQTFIGGIYSNNNTVTTGALPVFVDSTGQLGTTGYLNFDAIEFLLPSPVGQQPPQLSSPFPQSFTAILRECLKTGFIPASGESRLG
jgi:hypothetical protein